EHRPPAPPPTDGGSAPATRLRPLAAARRSPGADRPRPPNPQRPLEPRATDPRHGPTRVAPRHGGRAPVPARGPARPAGRPAAPAGRRDLPRHRLHPQPRLGRAPIGLLAKRLGSTRCQIGLGAVHRGTPVPPGDRDGLRVKCIGENTRARRGDSGNGTGGRGHCATPINDSARRVAWALDKNTSAPASASAAAWLPNDCGSPLVPTHETTIAISRPAARALSSASRIWGAVLAAGSASAPCPSTT